VSNSEFTLGVDGSDTVVVEVQFTVVDQEDTYSGVSSTATFFAEFADFIASSSEAIRIVAPVLSHSMTATPFKGDAGDEFVVTHTIVHASQSTYPAFNVTRHLLLDGQVNLLAAAGYGAIYDTTSGSDALRSTFGSADDLDGAGAVLAVMEMGLKDKLVFTHTMKMVNYTKPGLDTVFTSMVSFASRSTAPQRAVALANSTAVIRSTEVPRPGFEVQNASGSYAKSSPWLFVAGEQFVLQFEMRLPEGQIDGLTLEVKYDGSQGDMAPVIITKIDVVTTGALAFDSTVAFEFSSTDAASNLAGGRRRRAIVDEAAFATGVVAVFGQTTNAYDNSETADDVIVVQVTGKVADNGNNVNNEAITLVSVLASNSSTASTSKRLVVGEPLLDFAITLEPLSQKDAEGITTTSLAFRAIANHSSESSLEAVTVEISAEVTGNTSFVSQDGAKAVSSAFVLLGQSLVLDHELAYTASGVEDEAMCVKATVCQPTTAFPPLPNFLLLPIHLGLEVGVGATRISRCLHNQMLGRSAGLFVNAIDMYAGLLHRSRCWWNSADLFCPG